MNRRPDVLALLTGLIACAVAVLGLWAGFGTISWSAVTVAAPLCLVAIGLIGLIASRKS